jgi:hypothetical protein
MKGGLAAAIGTDEASPSGFFEMRCRAITSLTLSTIGRYRWEAHDTDRGVGMLELICHRGGFG